RRHLNQIGEKAGLGRALALLWRIMTLVFFHRIRRKAVWGPKRVGLALLIALLGLAPTATAGEHHSNQGKKGKPGAPNSSVHGYQIDIELIRRSQDTNPRNTSLVIVTIAPGTKLPGEFDKFRRKFHGLGGGLDDGSLDIINGQAIELPNYLIRKLAS